FRVEIAALDIKRNFRTVLFFDNVENPISVNARQSSSCGLRIVFHEAKVLDSVVKPLLGGVGSKTGSIAFVVERDLSLLFLPQFSHAYKTISALEFIFEI